MFQRISVEAWSVGRRSGSHLGRISTAVPESGHSCPQQYSIANAPPHLIQAVSEVRSRCEQGVSTLRRRSSIETCDTADGRFALLWSETGPNSHAPRRPAAPRFNTPRSHALTAPASQKQPGDAHGLKMLLALSRPRRPRRPGRLAAGFPHSRYHIGGVIHDGSAA